MTACNARPPNGHPFARSLVSCYLPAGHAGPHTWDMPAGAAARVWLASQMSEPIKVGLGEAQDHLDRAYEYVLIALGHAAVHDLALCSPLEHIARELHGLRASVDELVIE